MPDSTTMTAADLFDPAFLESLRRLHILARRVAMRGQPAEQRSRDLGAGIEFRDFRPYTPGDDFRSIDWTVYQRLGKVFLRLFEELEDLPVYILVDRSRSLFEETPPRIRAGLRTALALASIALNQHDRVGLFPFGTDFSLAMRPRSGRHRLHQFAKVLAGLTPDDGTDLRRSLRSFQALGLRSGLCVVISDFFDPAGLDAVIAALKSVTHRLLLVRLWRPTDERPDATGDFRFVDCETGIAEDVSLVPAVLQSYQRAYQRFDQGLTEFATQRGMGLLRLDADQEVVPQLATLFERGTYSP